jgi:hypothetical protein
MSSRRTDWLLVAALVLGASTASCWNTSAGDCKYACGPGGHCPQGMACVAGKCARPGATCGAPQTDGATDGVDASTDAVDAPMTDGAPDGPGDGRDAVDRFDGSGADERESGTDATDGSPDDHIDAGLPDDRPVDREPSPDASDILVSPGIVVAGQKLWKKTSITACWEQPGFLAEKQWIADAVADSWPAVSAVRVSGWGLCATGDANLRLRFAPSGSPSSRPLIGTDADHVEGGVELRADDIPDCTLASRKNCVSAYAVHRFGHALGFVHAGNERDEPQGCRSESDAAAPEELPPESIDEESVMNLCNPRGYLSAARLSARDIQGMASAYGLGPSSFVFHVTKVPWRQVASIDARGQWNGGQTTDIAGVELSAELMAVGHNGTILYYAAVQGGRLDVGTVSDDGDVAIVDTATGVGDWKLITAVQNGYFLAYTPDRNGGELAVFRVNALGRFEGRVYLETNVSDLWTHVAGTLTGELLFFDRAQDPGVDTNNGIGRVARVTPDGKVEIQDKWIFGFSQFDLLTAVNTNAVVLHRNAKPDRGAGLRQVMELSPIGGRRNIEVVAAPAYLEKMVGARNGAIFLFNDARGALDDLTGRIGLVDATGYKEVGSVAGFPDFHLISAE